MADLTSYEIPAHEAHALPVMLPQGKLIGRDVILARVYSQLKENKPVLVYGASGIGKTALAATLASAYTELPGGVLWLNVNNTPFPELLARIGRAFNLKDIATSDNPISMVNSATSALIAAKPLVVLDGQINAQAASELIMRVTGRLPVLLLNEQELAGPWTNVPLGILEPTAAASLFKTLSPEQTEGVDELVTALDGIPFAITVAAGATRAKKQAPAAFLAALPKRPGVTAPLLTLTASFGTLSNPLQGLLLLMGATFRGEASTELFSLVANAPEDTITQALGLLVQQHLVERFQRYGKAYYRLPMITYTFAQTWLRGSGRLEGLQAKVRDAVLAYARKYSGTPDRLAAEMENFLATARWAADQGDRDVANQLAVALMQSGDFVNARGYVYELLLLRRLAASSTNAFPAYGEAQAGLPFAQEEVELEDSDELEPLDDDSEILDEDESEAVDSVARTVTPIPANGFDDDLDELDEDDGDHDQDDFDDEDDLDLEEPDQEDEDDFDSDVYEEVNEGEPPVPEPELTDEIDKLRAQLKKQTGNKRQQAETLSAIGAEQVKRGQETEAISTYSEALTAYEAINDSVGTLAVLGPLASLTVKTDSSQAAVLHATRGAKLAEELGNEPSQINLLITLGDARQQLGESDEAVRVYSEVLDLARTSSDKPNEAMILFKLGYAQLDNGDPNTALKTWEDALTLFREQSRRDYEGRTLAALGTASGELERWNEAIKFYTSALHIARELKDSEEEMLRLSDLGYASVQGHQLGQAVLRYRQALHLAYTSNNRENIVSTTVDLARLLVESQRHLNITNMLVEGALKFDPSDRDLKRLKERIQDELPVVPETVQLAQVVGTAQDYAANAYTLLENS